MKSFRIFALAAVVAVSMNLVACGGDAADTNDIDTTAGATIDTPATATPETPSMPTTDMDTAGSNAGLDSAAAVGTDTVGSNDTTGN